MIRGLGLASPRINQRYCRRYTNSCDERHSLQPQRFASAKGDVLIHAADLTKASESGTIQGLNPFLCLLIGTAAYQEGSLSPLTISRDHCEFAVKCNPEKPGFI